MHGGPPQAVVGSEPAGCPPADWGRSYLMCEPDEFDVVYSINPWMTRAMPVNRVRAREQWESLVSALERTGARVQTIKSPPGSPDMVFTANAGLVVGRTFVPARMRHPERRGERPHFERWFAERGFEICRLGTIIHEGAGDALPFRGKLVGGYRSRSSADAYRELERLTGARTATLELLDPRYYHLDLVFCPLDDHHAMVAPSALTEEGRATIDALVPEPLMLTADEAASFCANSVVVGRTVVMPACTARVRRQLEDWGFEPLVVDVSEFQKAGGAVRCLTLPLDLEPAMIGAEDSGGRRIARGIPTRRAAA